MFGRVNASAGAERDEEKRPSDLCDAGHSTTFSSEFKKKNTGRSMKVKV
jgi:hypothetical protein